MTQATLGKWGNNLAVRLLGEIVVAAGLHDGEGVEIEIQNGAIVIRPAELRVARHDLFRGRTPEAWQAAYADAAADDWGSGCRGMTLCKPASLGVQAEVRA